MHVKRAYVVMKEIGKRAMLILNLSENEKKSIWDKYSHFQFFMLETLKSFLKRDEKTKVNDNIVTITTTTLIFQVVSKRRVGYKVSQFTSSQFYTHTLQKTLRASDKLKINAFVFFTALIEF